MNAPTIHATNHPFPGIATNISAARHLTVGVLKGWPTALVDDVAMVVSELATNAIRYTRSGDPGGWFECCLTQLLGAVVVHIHDQGGERTTPDPTYLGDGGRGLYICEQLGIPLNGPCAIWSGGHCARYQITPSEGDR